MNTHQTADCAFSITTQGTPPASEDYPEGGLAACARWEMPSVGESLPDEVREDLIRQCAREIERHMTDKQKFERDYDISNCFGDKGLADAARLKAQEAAGRMAALIRGRSPEYVSRLEQERGLS